jgi:hypothetical protein
MPKRSPDSEEEQIINLDQHDILPQFTPERAAELAAKGKRRKENPSRNPDGSPKEEGPVLKKVR